MNITHDEMIQSFIDAGWRAEKTREETTLVYKRVRTASDGRDTDADGNAVCATNARLSIHATIYKKVPYHSVEFDITGEYSLDGKEALWAKLSVYAVPWDRVHVERDRIERELLAAWDVMCALRRSR